MLAPAEKPREIQPPAYTTDAAGLWADIPSFTAFANEVHEALEGRELRYSQRIRLLKRASHFGLRSFDANLIIAMVQNRASGRKTAETAQDGKISVATLLTIFAAVQAVILAAGWWMIA